MPSARRSSGAGSRRSSSGGGGAADRRARDDRSASKRGLELEEDERARVESLSSVHEQQRAASRSKRAGQDARTSPAKMIVDYKLAEQIVTAAEAQWERATGGGKPMPLTLVLQTHKEVLRSRGADPIRDDHSVYKVREPVSLRLLHCQPGFSRHVDCVVTAGRAQFLIKLQAERPEVRWRDKLAAARKADSAKRRRARAKTGSKAATRSMLLAEERSEAALAELAKAPSVWPSQSGTEVWIAWRQWRAYMQYQKQLCSSGARKRDASHYKESVSLERSLESELIQAADEADGGARNRDASHYKEPVSLERSLESELIQVANEADDSKLGPNMASDTMPGSVGRARLSPAGVPSVSASHFSRTDSHTPLDRLKESVHTSTRTSAASPQSVPMADSGPMSSPSTSLQGGAGSQPYRLLRRWWQAWRDWLYSIALEQLALIETPRMGSTEDFASPAKAAVPISHIPSAAPSVEPRASKNTPQASPAHWDVVCENLRRCGRRRSHSFKATSHAHFLMHRARTRLTTQAELKLFAEQPIR